MILHSIVVSYISFPLSSTHVFHSLFYSLCILLEWVAILIQCDFRHCDVYESPASLVVEEVEDADGVNRRQIMSGYECDRYCPLLILYPNSPLPVPYFSYPCTFTINVAVDMMYASP